MAESSLEWADRFCDFYASKGLFRGEEALPLHCDCPAAPDCWEGESAYPPRHEASISIPWCGPDYRSGGVAVVAINMNKYGGLGAHWWIRLERIRELRRGRHRAFDYRLGTFVALALASLGGAPLDPEPDPESVADAWEAAAFLESVKCSPERGVGAPTGAMWRNCPDRYLVDELALLAPSVVIAVGKAPGEVLRRLLSPRSTRRRLASPVRRAHVVVAMSRSWVAITPLSGTGERRCRRCKSRLGLGRSAGRS